MDFWNQLTNSWKLGSALCLSHIISVVLSINYCKKEEDGGPVYETIGGDATRHIESSKIIFDKQQNIPSSNSPNAPHPRPQIVHSHWQSTVCRSSASTRSNLRLITVPRSLTSFVFPAISSLIFVFVFIWFPISSGCVLSVSGLVNLSICRAPPSPPQPHCDQNNAIYRWGTQDLRPPRRPDPPHEHDYSTVP